MELRLFASSMLLCLAVLFVSSIDAQEAELLVLMYHHVGAEGDRDVTVLAETFDVHLSTLTENGFRFVSFDDVIAFVDGEARLPPKPVCIVFDDGYASNYSLAFPILLKHKAKATVCVIGSSVGCDRYKNTGCEAIPHFSWGQAREMAVSGLVLLGSHTYDMHMNPKYESGTIREYAVPLPGESEAVFETAFRRDCELMSSLMTMHLGYSPTVFAYPHGKWSNVSERVLKEYGYRVTLVTEAGYNKVTKGDAESLYLLKRYNMNDNSDLSAIMAELPLS